MSAIMQQLEATYRSDRERLIRELQRLFPSLNEAACEDLVQTAFVAALQEAAKPGFVLQHSWRAWLRTAARNLAITFLRRREAWSLDGLQTHDSASGDSAVAPCEPAAAGLRPSQVLQQAERAERRRVLVSDILAAYARHAEHYGMSVQREVFERSLRGQEPPDAAREMGLAVQRVYGHRSRAFEWVRGEVQCRDARGSVLATVFGNRLAGPESPGIPPRRLHDLVQLAVDECGALCPSDQRLAAYQADHHSADVSDVRYHVTQARWYLDERPQEPGCRLCAARMNGAAHGH